MTKRLFSTLFTAALVFHTACAADERTDPDPDLGAPLTPEQVAALPDTFDPAHVELAEVLAAPDDGSAFDTDDAVEPVDQAVDDSDDPSDDAGGIGVIASQPLLKWGLHPRASDALRSIGVTSGRI